LVHVHGLNLYLYEEIRWNVSLPCPIMFSAGAAVPVHSSTAKDMD
jgi:hypothetical protein